MKIIKSLGGPLIGLPIGSVHLWGGADRPSFAGFDSGFPDDYEAAGSLTDGRNHPPCDAAVIRGAAVDGILITMPSETCILSSTSALVQIAQVHAAEHNWSFSDVELDFFKVATFEGNGELSSPGGRYTLFDSVFPGNESEYSLEFSLDEGVYTISSASIEREQYSLTLIKIDRKMASNVF